MKSAVLLAFAGPGLLLGGCSTAPQVTLDVPRSYQAPRTSAAPTIDGRFDEVAWAAAPQTELFVAIRGVDHPNPTWETHARMLWDDTHLYVGAWLEEPHLWGTLTERDAIIYHDHDFEVFLDPDGDGEAYFEIEINVLGTDVLNADEDTRAALEARWGVMFQDGALFSSLTVRENVEVPMRDIEGLEPDIRRALADLKIC